MAHHPPGLFPTLNGEPYADYPSLYNLLSFLTSGGGRWVTRFTLVLPSILLSCYVVAMTAKTSELLKPGTGVCAALFSLLSYEYINIFMAFSIDLPVAAAVLTIIWGLLKYDFALKALPIYVAMLILAFAVRGPLGIILCGAVTAGAVIGARRWKALLPYGALGAVTTAACLYLAYRAILRQGGPELWHTVKDWQVGSRVGGEKSLYAYFYYFTNAIGSFMPVTGFAVATLVMKRRELLKRELAIPIMWALLPMVMLSIPGCKHLRYMTPLLPAFAIFAAIGYLEADRSYVGKLIDFAILLMDKLILPLGIGLIATVAVLGFIIPAARLSLFLHLGAALALLLTLHFSMRGFDGKPWPLCRAALAMALLVGIAVTGLDTVLESSSRFVRKAERLCAPNGRIYLYKLSPDHDTLKVMYHLSPAARAKAVTIYRFDEDTSPHLKKMFPAVTPEEALPKILPEDVVVLQKKHLGELREAVEASGRRIVELDRKGRLGHRKTVTVRVLPGAAK